MIQELGGPPINHTGRNGDNRKQYSHLEFFWGATSMVIRPSLRNLYKLYNQRTEQEIRQQKCQEGCDGITEQRLQSSGHMEHVTQSEVNYDTGNSSLYI